MLLLGRLKGDRLKGVFSVWTNKFRNDTCSGFATSIALRKERMQFTAEEDAQIVKMRLEGCNLTNIGKALGRAPSSIYSRISYSLQHLHPDISRSFTKPMGGKTSLLISNDELLSRVERGETVPDIAKELGIPKSTLVTRFRQFKLSKQVVKPWTKAEYDRLAELTSDRPELSRSDIAALLGRSDASVLYQIRRMGLRDPTRQQSPRRRWTDSEIAELTTLRSQGKTLNEISALLNRPKFSVQAMSRKLKRRSSVPGQGESDHDTKGSASI